MNRVARTSLFLAGLLLAGVLILSCSSDKGGGPTEPGPFDVLHLELFEVDPLNAAFAYQLWGAEIDTTTLAASVGDWVRILTFRVTPNPGDPATILTLSGDPIPGNDVTGAVSDWDAYDTILITIEPAAQIPDAPAGPVYLTGRLPIIVNDQHRTAGLDFPEPLFLTSGFYRFFTPTDNNPDNDSSGIWFYKPAANPSASLTIGSAPAGWSYEGWAMHDGVWLSMGKFTDKAGADGSGQYSSLENATPLFPGEDFLMNHPSMPWVFDAQDSVVVTLEPDPDTDIHSRFSMSLMMSEIDSVSLGYDNPMTIRDGIDIYPDGLALFKRSDDN